MFSRWAYILIGRNNTGKTTFQRNLILHLCDIRYTRLSLNVVNNISREHASRTLRTIFTANRSYQEKKSKYKSVRSYFDRYFKDADVCVLASHPDLRDIEEMIGELKGRCFNVAGVFWTNAFPNRLRNIALLNWTEIMRIENPVLARKSRIENQLDHIAREFADLIVTRSHIQ